MEKDSGEQSGCIQVLCFWALDFDSIIIHFFALSHVDIYDIICLIFADHKNKIIFFFGSIIMFLLKSTWVLYAFEKIQFYQGAISHHVTDLVPM